MDDICCILSVQGFNIGRNFLARELAWINFADGTSGSYSFDLKPCQAGLSDKDRKTIRFTTSKLHGLSFTPTADEKVEKIEDFEGKLREIHEKCKAEGRDVIAFKGGPSTAGILKKLSIPCRNLEKYGCPKYSGMRNIPYVEPCGHHINALPCPISEVTAFREWCLKHKDEFSTRTPSSDEDCDDDVDDDDYY